MTWPGHPTQLSGKLTITSQIDAATSANIVTEGGKPLGLYFDDSTPEDDTWIAKAVSLGHALLLCACPPSSEVHHHPSPPCQNMAEHYPVNAGFPVGRVPTRYAHVIVQQFYPGLLRESGARSIKAPNGLRRWRLRRAALKAVGGDRDRVWLF